MTDQPRKSYVLPDIDTLTLDQLFVIKAATRVDVLRPPTVAHADAALLWFITKGTDEPLSFQELTALPLSDLADLIAEPDDEDDEEEPAGDKAEGEGDDSPKASDSSSELSSPSHAPGAAPQPPSAPAP